MNKVCRGVLAYANHLLSFRDIASLRVVQIACSPSSFALPRCIIPVIACLVNYRTKLFVVPSRTLQISDIGVERNARNIISLGYEVYQLISQHSEQVYSLQRPATEAYQAAIDTF